MSRTIILLAMILLPIVIILAITYGFTVSYIGRKAAQKEFFRISAMMGIIAIPIMIVGSFIPDTWHDTFQASLNLILSAFCIAMIIVHFGQQTKLGPVLLDLGRTDRNLWMILGGILYASSALPSLGELVQIQLTLEEFAYLVFRVSIGAMFLLIGFSKLMITGQGIFMPPFFIRWTSIASYDWEDSKRAVLNLKINKLFYPFNELPLILPIEYKEPLQKLLSQNISSIM